MFLTLNRCKVYFIYQIIKIKDSARPHTQTHIQINIQIIRFFKSVHMKTIRKPEK